MKKFIKVISMTLSLAMCLTAFSGCGKQQAENSDVKVIKIWSANGSSKAFYLDKIEEFNKTTGAKNGIKVEYEVVSDMNKMVELGMQTGDLPHMFSGSNLKTLVENDKIISLDQLPGGQELIDKNPIPSNLEACVYKDKVYCIPFNVGVRSLLYNKDMLIAAGYVDENGEAKPPKTLDELREYAKKMTNSSKNEYGIIFPFKWNSCLEDFLGMSQNINGFGTFNPTTGLYDLSSYQPILDTLMGIKNDGSFVQGVEGIDNDAARARFGAGGIAMKLGYSWDYGVLTDQFPAKIDWGIAPLPAESADGTKYKQSCTYGYTSKINKSVLDDIGADKFMIFLKWYLSDEFKQQLYEGGYILPSDTNIIKNIKLDEKMENWEAFAKIAEISAIPPTAVKTDTTGTLDIQSDFLKNVWSGNESTNDFIKRRQDSLNDGIKKYIELNPDYDSNQCIDKNWNIAY